MQAFQQESMVPTPSSVPTYSDIPQGEPIMVKRVNYYEYYVWSDGTIIIVNKLEAGYTRLSGEEARALRRLLNNGDVRAVLGIPLDRSPYCTTQQAQPLQGEKEDAHA